MSWGNVRTDNIADHTGVDIRRDEHKYPGSYCSVCPDIIFMDIDGLAVETEKTIP